MNKRTTECDFILYHAITVNNINKNNTSFSSGRCYIARYIHKHGNETYAIVYNSFGGLQSAAALLEAHGSAESERPGG